MATNGDNFHKHQTRLLGEEDVQQRDLLNPLSFVDKGQPDTSEPLAAQVLAAIPSPATAQVPPTIPSPAPAQVHVPAAIPSPAPAQVPAAIPPSATAQVPAAIPSPAPAQVPAAIPPPAPAQVPPAIPSPATAQVPPVIPPPVPAQLPAAIPPPPVAAAPLAQEIYEERHINLHQSSSHTYQLNFVPGLYSHASTTEQYYDPPCELSPPSSPLPPISLSIPDSSFSYITPLQGVNLSNSQFVSGYGPSSQACDADISSDLSSLHSDISIPSSTD